ncbi:hypothetical protein BDF14DRAFT_1853480 [Spinellus fusiger]|nr:hypothetical protein BDF14DRAFT_1853480 [Spinellus fusiger]
MHRRQIEEAVLESITHQLHSDNLPGILTILSSSTARETSEEVEIDLSCLPREQLLRILAYVEACICEQKGGLSVTLSDYIKEDTQTKTVSLDYGSEEDEICQPQKKRKLRQRKRKISPTTLETGSVQEVSFEPMSMASLSQEKTRGPPCKRKTFKSKLKQPSTSSPTVHTDATMSTSLYHTSSKKTACTRPTRPTRHAALYQHHSHKDSPASPEEESGDEQSSGNTALIVFSDEQMDFRVTDNQTIAHHSSPAPRSLRVMSLVTEDRNEMEDIDIML